VFGSLNRIGSGCDAPKANGPGGGALAGIGADMAKAKFTSSLVILGTEVGALTEDAIAVDSGLDRAEEGAVVGIVIKD
jgi:hypothetical protein